MTPEQAEVLGWFTHMLTSATADGGRKRAKGEKPSWKVDPEHEPAIYSHLHKWKHGIKVDPDSGAHPLVHLAWRALAIAWQETYGKYNIIPASLLSTSAEEGDKDNPWAKFGLTREQAEETMEEKMLDHYWDEEWNKKKISDALDLAGFSSTLYPTVEELKEIDQLKAKYNIKDRPSEKADRNPDSDLYPTAEEMEEIAKYSRPGCQEWTDPRLEFPTPPKSENPKEPLKPSPSPRVFVAAPWPSRTYARSIMNYLERAGATITYDWTVNSVDETSDTAIAELGVLAQRDIDGVLAADWLLALPDGKGEDTHPSRGTWLEVGLAIGRGIPVMLWPDCLSLLEVGCIYATLPTITVVRDTREILTKLGLQGNGGSR